MIRYNDLSNEQNLSYSYKAYLAVQYQALALLLILWLSRYRQCLANENGPHLCNVFFNFFSLTMTIML